MTELASPVSSLIAPIRQFSVITSAHNLEIRQTRDVLQMPSVFQPWPRRGYMVGRAFTSDLDENRCVNNVTAIPRPEGLKQLNAIRVPVHLDVDPCRLILVCWGLISELSGRVAFCRQSAPRRLRKVPPAPIDVSQRVSERVEGQIAGKAQSSNDLV